MHRSQRRERDLFFARYKYNLYHSKITKTTVFLVYGSVLQMVTYLRATEIHNISELIYCFKSL